MQESLPRPISAEEVAVIYRALEVCPTGPVSQALRDSVPTLCVIWRCTCGCDTVNFEHMNESARQTIVADGIGETPAGKEIGLIVFGKGDHVVSLEVYGFDNEPARLPTLDSIRPFGHRRPFAFAMRMVPYIRCLSSAGHIASA